MLARAGYAWVYAVGPRKKHGCLIAFRKDAFVVTRQRVVMYDEQDVREEGGSEAARRGLSFRTKNIASLVALRKLNGGGAEGGEDGVIVATTHLFWHPAWVTQLCTSTETTDGYVCLLTGTHMSVRGSYNTPLSSG